MYYIKYDIVKIKYILFFILFLKQNKTINKYFCLEVWWILDIWYDNIEFLLNMIVIIQCVLNGILLNVYWFEYVG